MRRHLLAMACVGGLAAAAHAQQPGYPNPLQPGPYQNFPGGYGGSGSVMPNIYNPQTQPLSPYLNLLRGGNPGVNYYYGVRPGTVGGAGSFGAATAPAMGGNRGPFFPQQAMMPDPFTLPEAGDGYSLPPAGHPTVFNNTLGYFPGGMGGRGMMGNRSGLSGSTGSARPNPTGGVRR